MKFVRQLHDAPPHGLFHALFRRSKHCTHTCGYWDNVERAKKLRVQLHAVVERCYGDSAGVIAEGPAARGGFREPPLRESYGWRGRDGTHQARNRSRVRLGASTSHAVTGGFLKS